MKPTEDQMRGLFTRIAGRYDVLNRALTFGVDVLWRRRALRMLVRTVPHAVRVLDLATGTADFALGAARVYPQARVTGIDLTPAMLEIGRRKVAKAGMADRVELCEGNAQALGFPDGTFDVATCAFGFRNFPDPEAALGEAARVLKPGGALLVLELFRMRSAFFAHATSAWLRLAAPLLAGTAKGDYAYLRASVERTLSADDFAAAAARAGFAREGDVFFRPSCHCLILRKYGTMCA